MRRVAAVANANAHRVTPAVIATLRRELGDRLAVTHSVEEARAAVARLVGDGCEVLCVAGGDGTFVQTAADVHEVAPARPPILFPLRCGLGNAIADISGASAATPAGLTRDVARARSDEPARPLRLVRANGRVAHYAGVGLDAIFVEDLYRVAKGRFRRAAASLGGVPGLVATVALRTLPRLLAYRPPRVRITTLAPAHPLAPDGAKGAPIAAGTVLHDGPVLVAAGGTIASYGRDFQAFPLADAVQPAHFHLRAWSIGGAELLRHLPAVWRGTYFPARGLGDWAASAVRLEWDAPHVIHIGGDLTAPTTRIEMEILPWEVRLLRRR